MNTNKLCKTVLDIKEVMEAQIKQKILSERSLSEKEKEILGSEVESITSKYIDIMIDNILKSESEST